MKSWLASAPLTFVLMACGSDRPAVQPSTSPTVTLALPASTLRAGDNLALTTSVDRTSAYLYLYSVDPAGQIQQLLPNRTGSATKPLPEQPFLVEAGQTIAFPSKDARFSVFVEGPPGTSTLVAFASVQPLNLDALRTYPSTSDTFAQMNIAGFNALSEGLKMAADALPGNLYAQTTAAFTVVK